MPLDETAAAGPARVVLMDAALLTLDAIDALVAADWRIAATTCAWALLRLLVRALLETHGIQPGLAMWFEDEAQPESDPARLRSALVAGDLVLALVEAHAL